MKPVKKRKGAHADLLKRQLLRQQGLLNAPLRGPKGLGGYHGLAYLLRKRWGGLSHPPDWVREGTVMRPPRRLI